MRILITNIRLALRSGTEIVVRDLALRLSERQHEVVIYSPEIGKLAEELTSCGISVIDDLLKVEHAPDVIHGHHMPCTAQAILAFPQTPAIWICHSSSAWFDAPPRFAQVRRMFAVDDTCRKRLIEADHVAADAVSILPNAVDLRRFPTRSAPLSDRPMRALSLVKHGGPEILIAEACRQAGLTFEAYGHGVGREIDDVERRCAQADIVFATARTALEAMAAGAAVILIDGRGFGGLVTTANYDEGRRLNFGLGMLRHQATVTALTEAIDSYDATDAARVSELTRQDADLDLTILRLEQIYNSVVQETAEQAWFDPNIFRCEQIDFCRSWLLHLEPSQQWLEDRTLLLSQNAALAEYVAAQAARLAELQDHTAAQDDHVTELLNQFAAQSNHVTELQDQVAAQRGRVIQLQDQSAARSAHSAELQDQIIQLQDQIIQRKMTIETLTSQIASSERSRAVRFAKFIRRSLGLTRH